VTVPVPEKVLPDVIVIQSELLLFTLQLQPVHVVTVIESLPPVEPKDLLVEESV
jgi:hypothetical protein